MMLTNGIVYRTLIGAPVRSRVLLPRASLLGSRCDAFRPLKTSARLLNLKPNVETEPKPLKIIDNIYTIPNFLTMTRIATAPVIGYCIYTGYMNTAISLFTYSCVTDFLDGFIARKFNMKSILGTILDPIADKLLMGICTISLSVVSIMPGYMGALIIGKDAMLALMGVYYRYVTLPAPKTFKRFANLSIPTVSVEPNLLSKINTGLQMVYVGNLVFKPQIEQWIMSDYYGALLGNFEVLVAATTLISALSYIFSKRSIKTLGDKLKI
ncbi:phosphatidylglycerophosphate synthase [Yamadazyma tenuis]|uniref:Uncharacterized protein n=1 Tax=Candida tenuis (strain ATCC 10573 / BCRC 21748 / CBS 615 / JCM 9827 / NBRC 10315 / NRRL Y-1498 / VKM Y-70) TaxID=590646 RepID=G3B718_CANTC|nr:uncharacterized protein CANTEDRAFT_114385 [Yamadazyma tenuis ATCC 10573]XP_006686870.1 uncharacterized protein CANTEDRAFT_114385 [Yamadazyma tenuis ATCC 10573]EGV63076.1 hypothetical protein CANTEDRAFT_114385 [Yamadazyma tenuis ATCC 10573]EGV63077.1 hypothetical protein CANTEDRAFT_114385 [Yamadazyma tenuis ATCC 10573]WEJ97108.1 phosphatidylglycerophosphate synthase [Yamadazyma tenuis]